MSDIEGSELATGRVLPTGGPEWRLSANSFNRFRVMTCIVEAQHYPKLFLTRSRLCDFRYGVPTRSEIGRRKVRLKAGQEGRHR
jgi:hypothetical protein